MIKMYQVLIITLIIFIMIGLGCIENEEKRLTNTTSTTERIDNMSKWNIVNSGKPINTEAIYGYYDGSGMVTFFEGLYKDLLSRRYNLTTNSWELWTSKGWGSPTTLPEPIVRGALSHSFYYHFDNIPNDIGFLISRSVYRANSHGSWTALKYDRDSWKFLQSTKSPNTYDYDFFSDLVSYYGSNWRVTTGINGFVFNKNGDGMAVLEAGDTKTGTIAIDAVIYKSGTKKWNYWTKNVSDSKTTYGWSESKSGQYPISGDPGSPKAKSPIIGYDPISVSGDFYVIFSTDTVASVAMKYDISTGLWYRWTTDGWYAGMDRQYKAISSKTLSDSWRAIPILDNDKKIIMFVDSITKTPYIPSYPNPMSSSMVELVNSPNVAYRIWLAYIVSGDIYAKRLTYLVGSNKGIWEYWTTSGFTTTIQVPIYSGTDFTNTNFVAANIKTVLNIPIIVGKNSTGSYGFTLDGILNDGMFKNPPVPSGTAVSNPPDPSKLKYLGNLSGTVASGLRGSPGIDKDGYVYYVTGANTKVWKVNYFASETKYYRPGIGWSSWGTAYDPINDLILITNPFSNTIFRVKRNGTLLDKWKAVSPNPSFNHTWDVTVNDKLKRIYIANNSRIDMYDTSKNFIKKFGVRGTGVGQIEQSIAIDIDGKDNIYVVDKANDKILKFDKDGTFLLEWGRKGINDGEFFYPSSIAIDSKDRIYIGDSYNKRIQAFSSDGNYLYQFTDSSIDMNWWPIFGLGIDKQKNVLYIQDTSVYSIIN